MAIGITVLENITRVKLYIQEKQILHLNGGKERNLILVSFNQQIKSQELTKTYYSSP